MIIDRLDVSYADSWNSEDRRLDAPMPPTVAARRHTAGSAYTVLLAAAGRPLATIEFWNEAFWRVYLFDERLRRTHCIDVDRENGKEPVISKARWRYADDEEDEFGGEPARETMPIGAGDVFPATFGDWRGLAHFVTEQGHDLAPAFALREVASAGGYPGPLRPDGIERLFTTGARVALEDGSRIVEVQYAGALRMPSGRLIAADPGWLAGARPFTITVPPGEYDVTLSVVSSDRWPASGMVAAARLTVVDEPISTWEMALLPDEDPGRLAGGQFYGFGVDTALGCFLDAAGVAELREAAEDWLDDLGFDTGGITAELTAPETGTNLIVFRSGAGDGSYPTWVGRTEDGRVACFVADMLLVRAG